MLCYGRQYGEDVVQSIVFPDPAVAPLLDADDDELNEAGREAVNMFVKSRKRAQKDTWGKAARAQMIALWTLASTMSVDK